MEFQENLALLRRARGLSQQDLAEALEVSRQAVSRWEVGASTPSTENLLALSKLFGVSVDELIGAAEPGETPGQKGETGGEAERPARLKRSRFINQILLAALAAAVTGWIFTAVLLGPGRASQGDPEFQVIKIEDMEREVISDSENIIVMPVS